MEDLASHRTPVDRIAARDGAEFPVSGFVRKGFEPVLERFMANFEEGLDFGAAVAAYHEGELVVDLWGGYASPDHQAPWREDTLVCCMSVTKAVAAVCMARAAEEGLFALDEEVARCWPDFGRSGKQDIRIGWVLDHRAGLPALRAGSSASVYDPGSMQQALADMAPLWTPGTECGYHVLTQGFLLDAIVRRSAGVSLAEYYRRELAGPLALEFHVGLTPAQQARCAAMVLAPLPNALSEARRQRDALAGRVWAGLLEDEDFNSAAWRGAEIWSANGHGTARSVAGLMAALSCGGVIEGRRILSEASVRALSLERHRLPDQVRGQQYRQAAGVVLNTPPVCFLGPQPQAFGHAGMGGSLAMADPAGRVAFAYTTPRMHKRLDNGPRAGKLVAALYESLGVPCRLPDYSLRPVAGWPDPLYQGDKP